MADYYTKLSFMIEADRVGKAVVDEVYRMFTACEMVVHEDDESAGVERRLPARVARSVFDGGFGVEFAMEGDDLWVRSEDNPNTNALSEVICEALRRHDSKAAVGFMWSLDCSKSRTDAFGGGLAVVTARGVYQVSTLGIMEELVERLLKGDDDSDNSELLFGIPLCRTDASDEDE